MDPEAERTISDIVTLSDALELLGFHVMWVEDDDGLTLHIQRKRYPGFIQGDEWYGIKKPRSWRRRFMDHFR